MIRLTAMFRQAIHWKRLPNCVRPIRRQYVKLSKKSMAAHVQAMLDLQKMGAIVFDYGNNIRQVAFD